jgi:dolichyl-phosphate beta-glucosyltransferase
VPVYNEEVRLAESAPHLIAFVAGFGAASELIIADDGSTDRTLEVADALSDSAPPVVRVRVLALPHRGKGATVQAGLLAAEGTVSAFCDVDLATPLDDLDRLVRIVSTGVPVVAAASRDVVTTTLVRPESPERELLGKLYNRLIQVTVLPGVRDTQCGAKAALTSVWRTVLAYTREPGFAWDVEALAVARRLGFAVWEVGVAWSHDDRSKVRPLRDGASMVRAVPRIWRSARRAEALRCFADPVVEQAEPTVAGYAVPA